MPAVPGGATGWILQVVAQRVELGERDRERFADHAARPPPFHGTQELCDLGEHNGGLVADGERHLGAWPGQAARTGHLQRVEQQHNPVRGCQVGSEQAYMILAAQMLTCGVVNGEQGLLTSRGSQSSALLGGDPEYQRLPIGRLGRFRRAGRNLSR